jgi:hypothetical protein
MVVELKGEVLRTVQYLLMLCAKYALSLRSKVEASFEAHSYCFTVPWSVEALEDKARCVEY